MPMKPSLASLFVLLWTTTTTTIVTAQQPSCPDFVPINTTGIGTDFTRVVLAPNCPESGVVPGRLRYHIHVSSAATTTDASTVTLTGSAADVMTPVLDARGLRLELDGSWSGSGAVGVELFLRSDGEPVLNALEVTGTRDDVTLSDDVGGLRDVLNAGTENRLRIRTAQSDVLTYAHDGGGGGVTVIDAPDAALRVDVNEDDVEVRIVRCRTLTGTLAGNGNRLVVVSGEIVVNDDDDDSLRGRGTNNEIVLNSAVTGGGCEDLVLEGSGNSCVDDGNETATVTDQECVGPEDYTFECSSSSSAAAGYRRTVAVAVSGLLVAAVTGAWVNMA